MTRRRRVGVVADDITGANDIGVMLAQNGYATGVFSLHVDPRPEEMSGLDAVVINTDSRLDDAQTARRKTAQACAILQALPCDLYHSKTCSVFRGNIGPQFDEMRRCLGVSCSMVVLGFPRNGRTTVKGEHFVYGVPLAQSMFRNDPIHPMTQSNLVDILSGQSEGRVRLFDVSLLDLAPDAQKRALEAMKKTCEYVIFDVRDQKDLRTIAALIADETSVCGSSAICEELPKVWAPKAARAADGERICHRLPDAAGTLIVSGSLTGPTKGQVAYLLGKGVYAYPIPTWELLEDRTREAIVAEVSKTLADVLNRGENVLLYGAQDEASVARTMTMGRERGLDGPQVGRLVSGTLGEIAARAARRAQARRVVVAGGETSAAVSDALGIRKMLILDEIEAGVPAMYGYGEDGQIWLLVFKSGSFGSEAFLEKSDACLRSMQDGRAEGASELERSECV